MKIIKLTILLMLGISKIEAEPFIGVSQKGLLTGFEAYKFEVYVNVDYYLKYYKAIYESEFTPGIKGQYSLFDISTMKNKIGMSADIYRKKQGDANSSSVYKYWIWTPIMISQEIPINQKMSISANEYIYRIYYKNYSTTHVLSELGNISSLVISFRYYFN